MAEFGVRGHDFGRMAPGELARKIGQAGFTCLQLAPAKALAGYPGAGDPEAERAFARAAAADFRANGIKVAVLGCYVEALDPDPRVALEERERFSRAIGLCADYGSALVATETGRGTAAGYAALARAAERWAREAEAAGVSIAIEPVFGHTVSEPRLARRLLDDIGSKSLGIIYDPANLVDPSSPGEQGRLFGLALELLGERVMAVHAKDLLFSGGRKTAAEPGSGGLDWDSALRDIASLPLRPPILIEDLRPDRLAAARSFLQPLVEQPRARGPA
jgi:sugar phosphate isomerase/epimerase